MTSSMQPTKPLAQPIIAKCVAEAGYGTSYYDPETHECAYEAYASVTEVILNEKYWDQYDSMSRALSMDFDLGMNFESYELTVYRDGTKEAKII